MSHVTIEEARRMPLLKRGMSKPSVKVVKSLLRSQGAWNGTDSEDFGPKLEAAIRYFQTTHLGPNGRYLTEDGEIGGDTWWALYNPTGVAQRSFIKPVATEQRTPDHITQFENRYGRLSQARKDFLRAAFNEYGKDVREIPDGANCGGEVNKYIAGFGPAPWCALFVSWLFKQVMGRYPNNARQAHVQTGWRTAAMLKRTLPKGKTPMPGDLVIWHFDKGQGHVAIVVAVSQDGRTINTIGGNEGNRVKLGVRYLDEEPRIAGFIDLFSDDRQGERQFIRGLLQVDEKAKLTAQGSR